MNKPQAHKEFVFQLERFLQTYFNPGETISTFFLAKALRENGMHPVHAAYQKYVDLCGFRKGHWTLTDFARVGKHMKYCKGYFVKKVRLSSRNYAGSYIIQRRNYIVVPGTPRVKTEDLNYILIG